ncbi:hypothetical protein CC78DRAFT_573668 [Lojkania enalia]|uniref:Uncharacterized protein n=1 Tax=Lojkania enalia TaxID=147567 RepID=A0A9P4NC17_9PLEO|nr:hypothetical protein CC78DRAFT_573668 [Didymosphaeria enalia]
MSTSIMPILGWDWPAPRLGVVSEGRYIRRQRAIHASDGVKASDPHAQNNRVVKTDPRSSMAAAPTWLQIMNLLSTSSRCCGLLAPSFATKGLSQVDGASTSRSGDQPPHFSRLSCVLPNAYPAEWSGRLVKVTHAERAAWTVSALFPQGCVYSESLKSKFEPQIMILFAFGSTPHALCLRSVAGHGHVELTVAASPAQCNLQTRHPNVHYPEEKRAFKGPARSCRYVLGLADSPENTDIDFSESHLRMLGDILVPSLQRNLQDIAPRSNCLNQQHHMTSHRAIHAPASQVPEYKDACRLKKVIPALPGIS